MRFLLFIILLLSQLSFGQKSKEDCAKLYENKDLQGAFDCYTFLADSLNDYYFCAKIADELGDSKSKKLWSKNMVKVFSDLPSTYYLLGQLEGFESSTYLKPLNKGLKKHPDDLLLVNAKLTYLYINMKYADALKSVEKMIELEPQNADNYSTKGFILDGLKLEEDAIQAFEKSVALDLNHKESNYFLGLTYYGRAISDVTKSNAESDSLAYTQHIASSLNNFELARPYLEKVYRITPKDEEVVKALLKCYLRLGKMEQYRLLLDDKAKVKKN